MTFVRNGKARTLSVGGMSINMKRLFSTCSPMLSNILRMENDKGFIHEDEETVSIGVQDQGIGIAENKKKSIFVRFENLVDRNLFNPSTGIGLSLVKELVEMHKALITVDSKLGEGSCFKIDFMKGKEQYDESVEFMQDDITVGLEAYHRQTADTEDAQPHNRKRVLRKKAVEMHPKI